MSDGDPSSYWASGYDPAENTVEDVQLNLGSPKQISAISVDWEYPAKAFEVQVGVDGSWTTIFATSGNNLNHTTVISGILGSQIRVRMKVYACGVEAPWQHS